MQAPPLNISSYSTLAETMLNAVLASFDNISPVLRRCENGGWLAVAPEESPVHIGVFAWSVDDARNRFFKARASWHLLLEEVVRDSVADASSE